MSRQRGLLTHLFFYIVFGGLFIATQRAIQNLIPAIFNEESSFVLLQNLPFAFVIIILWTGGVISHGITVFYNTGGRLERRRERIDEVMTRRYGDQWLEIATDQEYKRARAQVNRRFDAITRFFQHVVTAICVVGAVTAAWQPAIQPLLIDLLESEEGWAQAVTQAPMPLIFALLMALSVALHGITVFFGQFMGQDVEEQALERELERERALIDNRASRKIKRESASSASASSAAAQPRVRLTEDGEFTESMVETLNSLDDDARSQRR